MTDKKEYHSMLKLLDATTKIETTANKLGELGIAAEDPQIKESATILAAWLRSPPLLGQNAKARLLDMAKNLAAGSIPVEKRRGTGILALETYCRNMIASRRPQWQEIALAQGWRPPPIK